MRKSSIVELGLGSEFALTSDRFDSENYSLEKIQKSISFDVETSEKNIVTVSRGVFRTQSNIYHGAFLTK